MVGIVPLIMVRGSFNIAFSKLDAGSSASRCWSIHSAISPLRSERPTAKGCPDRDRTPPENSALKRTLDRSLIARSDCTSGRENAKAISLGAMRSPIKRPGIKVWLGVARQFQYMARAISPISRFGTATKTFMV